MNWIDKAIDLADEMIDAYVSSGSAIDERKALRAHLEQQNQAVAPQASEVAPLHCGPCESRCPDCPIDWTRFKATEPQQSRDSLPDGALKKD